MAKGSCELRKEGRPYPRTCEVCGLGPCSISPPLTQAKATACVRVIVQTSDAGMAVNVGGHVSQEFKTFMIEAPELVAFLSVKLPDLVNRSVIGVEVAP